MTPQGGLSIEFSNINIRCIWCHDRNFCQKYTVASIEAIAQSSHILQISYIPLYYCETLAKVHLELLM